MESSRFAQKSHKFHKPLTSLSQTSHKAFTNLLNTSQQNLTRWGEALLELSQFGNLESSKRMLGEAVSKFEEALLINPRKHHTLWCLGNAFTNQGLLTPGIREAGIYFDQACDCFEKAVMEPLTRHQNCTSKFRCTGLMEVLLLQRQIHMQGIDGGPAGGPAIAKDTRMDQMVLCTKMSSMFI